MRLSQLVFKDVLRRKKRVLYATLGVVIGIMTVVGILTIALAGRAKIYEQLEKYGANLSILPATQSLDTGLGDLTLGTLTIGENYIDQARLPQIQRIADYEIKKALDIKDDSTIAVLAPKLYVATDIAGTAVMLVGIDPTPESAIKTWWQVREGKYLESGNEAMLGAVAADVLKLKLNDAITLNGKSIVITGILEESGSNEDYQVFLPPPTLQSIFNKPGLISAIDIRALCNACPVDVIAGAINADVPGVRAVAVKQVAATEMGMLQKIQGFMLSLGGVTLLVGGFGVVNTLLTSIHERRRDIAIMRAVGASRQQVVRALIYEAVIIGVVGGILGFIAGTLLAYGLGPVIFEGTAIKPVPLYLPVSIGLALIISVAATLYPALRATSIKIAEAFRSL